MKLPKIGAVVVNYNNPESTRETLSSLLQQSNKKEFELKIYLINNGCTDTDSANLAEEFESVILLESKTNLGFAGGNNLGIKKALVNRCDYLLIVNNDVTILSDNFFETLLKSTSDITAPLIEYKREGKTIYDFGGKVDLLFGRNTHLTKAGKPDYFSGACLFVKSQVFKKLIGFDEKFFLYYEDVDFCLRAKCAGFTLGQAVNAKVFHLLSDSTNKLGVKKIKILAASHLRFCLKHLSIFSFPLYYFFNLYLNSKRIAPYVSWKSYEMYKSAYPFLNRVYCFLNNTPQIHLIGDSHTWSYYYHHPFLVHHLGAATAYNLGNPNSSTNSYQELMNLLPKINKSKDLLLFELGEIDCRVHIYNQYCKGNKKQKISTIIALTVEKYLAVLDKLISQGYKVSVLSPTPTGTEKNIYHKPFFADFKLRAEITRDFHQKLKLEAKKRNIPYINLFEKVVSKDGGIKKVYRADEVHLNSKVVPFTLSIIKTNATK